MSPLKDSLTNCLNHAELEQYFTRLVNVNSKQNNLDAQLSLLCIDIHQFRNFVDEHGMVKGDEIIIDIANKLLALYGPEDVYRIGGEEFIVTLNNHIENVNIPDISTEVQLKHTILNLKFKLNPHPESHREFQYLAFNYFIKKAMIDAKIDGHTINENLL